MELQVAGDGHELSQALLFADGVDAARLGVRDGERRHGEPICVLRTEPELGSGEWRVSGVVHQRTHEIGVAALVESLNSDVRLKTPIPAIKPESSTKKK